MLLSWVFKNILYEHTETKGKKKKDSRKITESPGVTGEFCNWPDPVLALATAKTCTIGILAVWGE